LRPEPVRASSKQYTQEFPKFHPNPFTSGGVIAERVNIVEMRHKVFPKLGEASSLSNETVLIKPTDCWTACPYANRAAM